MPGQPAGTNVFRHSERVPEDLQSIQASENDPNDCAAEPHGCTHSVDMLRYYCVSRRLGAAAAAEAREDFMEEGLIDYDSYMTGGLGEKIPDI